MFPSERRVAIARCFGVGIALHALILVTLFVDKLSDREAFSATVYLMYARLFCMAVLALSTAWVFDWLHRMRTSASALTPLEVPIAVGAAALAMALVRQNAVMGVLALAGGATVGLMIAGRAGSGQSCPLDRPVTRDERSRISRRGLYCVARVAAAVRAAHHGRPELPGYRRGRPRL